jgi:thioredoxin-like negative regulator of GroEL
MTHHFSLTRHLSLVTAFMDQLKFIDVRTPMARALLLLPVALALVCSWYALRWYMGNTIVEYAPSLEDGALETARTGLSLAPDDPLAHWTVAGLEKRSLDPLLLPDVVRQYEEAVSLSPNDYRLWMDLGMAREQAGDAEGGEKALRRAVELAPSYADPRWFLGNLLLRAGRQEEAFAELRLAGEANPATYRSQIFNLAWQVFNGNAIELRRAVGESAEARGALASFLAGRGRIDEALNLWSSLSQEEKGRQRDVGLGLMSALVVAKRYRAAQGLFRDLSADGGAGVEVGQFQNGGFENEMTGAGGAAAANPFGWQVKSVPQAQIALDPRHGHAGGRSLRVTFNAPDAFTFDNLSQLVVVEPSTQYHLECYVRTEELKSAGAPIIEIVDSTDGSVIANSSPLPVGKNDWQPLTVDFKTASKTEAVTVRTGRAPCSMEGSVCPIFGTIWYDDFNLQRGNGSAGTGRRGGVGPSSDAKGEGAR